MKAISSFVGVEYAFQHRLYDPQGRRDSDVWLSSLLESFEKAGRAWPTRAHIERAILLNMFWGEYYVTAKHGLDSLKIPANRLFTEREAKLAVEHAEECVTVGARLAQTN